MHKSTVRFWYTVQHHLESVSAGATSFFCQTMIPNKEDWKTIPGGHTKYWLSCLCKEISSESRLLHSTVCVSYKYAVENRKEMLVWQHFNSCLSYWLIFSLTETIIKLFNKINYHKQVSRGLLLFFLFFSPLRWSLEVCEVRFKFLQNEHMLNRKLVITPSWIWSHKLWNWRHEIMKKGCKLGEIGKWCVSSSFK